MPAKLKFIQLTKIFFIFLLFSITAVTAITIVKELIDEKTFSCPSDSKYCYLEIWEGSIRRSTIKVNPGKELQGKFYKYYVVNVTTTTTTLPSLIEVFPNETLPDVIEEGDYIYSINGNGGKLWVKSYKNSRTYQQGINGEIFKLNDTFNGSLHFTSRGSPYTFNLIIDVIYDDIKDCKSLSNSKVYCNSTGKLFVATKKFNLDNITILMENNLTSLQGFSNDEEIIKILNISVNLLKGKVYTNGTAVIGVTYSDGSDNIKFAEEPGGNANKTVYAVNVPTIKNIGKQSTNVYACGTGFPGNVTFWVDYGVIVTDRLTLPNCSDGTILISVEGLNLKQWFHLNSVSISYTGDPSQEGTIIYEVGP